MLTLAQRALASFRRASDETATYRHAYETTAADRDRIVARLDRLCTLVGMSAGVLESQEAAIRRGVGPVLLATLPKSGSVYLWWALNLTLDAPMYQVAQPRSMMDERPVEPQLSVFAQGGMVAQHHLSPEAVPALKERGIDRLVVHLRDPRQGAVSWWHYGTRIGQIGPLSDAEREDYLWTHYLVPAVEWIEGWLNADIETFISTHEDLARDAEAHVARICRFYGLDLPVALPEKSERTHYRSGRNDEWRAFFSPAFQERITALIPAHIEHRFGWL